MFLPVSMPRLAETYHLHLTACVASGLLLGASRSEPYRDELLLRLSSLIVRWVGNSAPRGRGSCGTPAIRRRLVRQLLSTLSRPLSLGVREPGSLGVARDLVRGPARKYRVLPSPFGTTPISRRATQRHRLRRTLGFATGRAIPFGGSPTRIESIEERTSRKRVEKSR